MPMPIDKDESCGDRWPTVNDFACVVGSTDIDTLCVIARLRLNESEQARFIELVQHLRGSCFLRFAGHAAANRP